MGSFFLLSTLAVPMVLLGFAALMILVRMLANPSYGGTITVIRGAHAGRVYTIRGVSSDGRTMTVVGPVGIDPNREETGELPSDSVLEFRHAFLEREQCWSL